MPIQQGLTNSFKQEMLQAGQNLATDTLRMALYTAFSDIGPLTTVYTTSNELPTGSGYTAGGVQVTGATITTDVQTGTVFVDFNNVSWPGANFTARGALIYNVTRSNKTVAVLDFGSDKTFSAVSNAVVMPVNSATTALIRFP
jgi:alpha-D-ribose 1-methylphosphonate 5-phosphate C-P lyase